ncbi:hypothetical protein ACE38W_03350 [Chitinophaga sp. Hz27]|uniref:hypothetical protein n=1 Tax=Chitinophaga sp. Hz27 TaxID=3347169 RepID=UPI0035D6F80E
MNYEAKAIEMVMDFSVTIEKWFCGDESLTVEQLLQYFSTDFEMIGAAGKTMNFTQLADWLPGVKGAKPGIQISMKQQAVMSTFYYTLVYYEEVQQQEEVINTRRSSALFRLEDGALKWWRLTEEWV